MSGTIPDDLALQLRAWAPSIEEALIAGCEDELSTRREEWSDFEIAAGFDELFRLRDSDLAYDRPSIGVHYAYWYHLRRTHELVRILGPQYLGKSDPLSIIDFGTGTGATLWATALLAAAARETGFQWPTTTVIGIDASPYMLDAARTLWTQLAGQRWMAKADVSADFLLGNWASDQSDLPDAVGDHIVVASYLFDASDVERMQDLADRFTLVCRKRGYRNAVVTSPQTKSTIARAFENALYANWTIQRPTLAPAIWNTGLPRLASSRASLLASVERVSKKAPTWSNNPPEVMSLQLVEAELIRIPRATLVCDPEQEAAAEPNKRMASIVGAAGSGKSRVICERVVRVVERSAVAEHPSILLTSFNKGMIDQLARWVEERLSASDDIPDHTVGMNESGYWTFEGRNSRGAEFRITLLNRDKLPTRIFGITDDDLETASVEASIEAMVHERFGDDFLDAEYERVLLAHSPMTRDRYVSPSFRRQGRGKPLQTPDRGIVWDYLMARPPNIFSQRRMAVVTKYSEHISTSRRIPTSPAFTHVFVDECQDFTAAEFKLLALLPPTPHGLCIAGDETQSIHLGASYHRPGNFGAQWDPHVLSGSYRLPARVCAAVRVLAEAVEADHRSKDSGTEGALPEIRKSAALGPRPVVVAGEQIPEQVAGTIRTLKRHRTGTSPLTVVRGRVGIAGSAFSGTYDHLKQVYADLETVSMLSFKGLEREFVIFPSCDTSNGEESTLEWVYTSLTRSVGVVMILIFNDTPPDTAAALSLLSPDHLLFWDSSARKAFDALGG